MTDWVSRPDDVERLIEQWQQLNTGLLTVEQTVQYAERPVFVLTVTDPATPLEQKKKALFFKPHAHEPAPIAGQMNVISQLLTGRTISGASASIDRDRYLAETLLCFMPDANPAGTAAAPVDVWDGTQFTNEEFWAWMRGVDPETGKMWKRVDLWDDTTEDPLPTRYGIVYEQISEHEYVEPNRHVRSSFMHWLHELRARYQWDRMLDLHQTEFVGQTQNCMIILPTLFNEQPSERQAIERQWANEVIEAWGRLPGGRPITVAEPLNYTGEQRDYFVKVFGDIYRSSNIITSEIQNNSLLTPPALQRQLNEAAITATIENMLAHR